MAKALLALALILALPVLANPSTAVDKARLPEGLVIEIFAEGIDQARSLDIAEDGTVAVGSSAQAIFLLRDDNGDGKVDVRLSLNEFRNPTGVAWQGKDLYVAETSSVWKIADAVTQLQSGGKVMLQEVISGLPTSYHHGRRFIDFGPDGNLFVALGVPCNICEPPDEDLTATIRKYDLINSSSSTYAYGLRNSVGFDWHPATGEMWATDNGRDWLGDDAPYDELNRVHSPGLHFGFPYCHQGDLPDPKFGNERSCSDFEAPALNIGPHVASLGIHITAKDAALAPNSALIALHGSWNRSVPIGYEVRQVRFDDTGTMVVFHETFVSGWLRNGQAYARPVDVATLPDGSVLISDDQNGAVYRISRISVR